MPYIVKQINICLKYLLILTSLALSTNSHCADTPIITVSPSEAQSFVNKYVFGNNIKAYYPRDKHGVFTNYGGGVWDPVKRKSSQQYLDYAKSAGISVLRWPGGNNARLYDWKKMVGPVSNRPNQQFGLYEFLTFCEDLGALPIITLPAIPGNELSISELVEYLNAPADGSNKNGGIDWAQLRKKQGRALPWNVVYFEYGNETSGTDMPVNTYTASYKSHRKLMKNVDSSIQLGAVLSDSINVNNSWSSDVLTNLKDQIDFAIIHVYTPVLPSAAVMKVDPENVAKAAVSIDADLDNRLVEYNRIIKEITGRDNVQIAITEYNGNYSRDKPVPYRFTMANAIRNADFLRIVLQPKYNILMANYWLFANEHWGQVREKKDKTHAIVKQLDQLVFEMFNEYTADLIVQHSETSDYFEYDGGLGIAARLYNKNSPKNNRVNAPYILDKQWNQRWFTDVKQDEIDGVLNVVFNGDVDVDYHNSKKQIHVEPDTSYRVTVEIKTHDIKNGKVGITVGDVRGWGDSYLESSNVYISGSTEGWKKISADFHTFGDTKKIKVTARRFKGNGRISGEVQYRNVEVKKISRVYGPVQEITSIWTTTTEGDMLKGIIINKNMIKSKNVTIKINSNDKFNITSSVVLYGDNVFSNNYLPLANNIEIQKIPVRRISDQTYSITLPAASIAGISFDKKQH